MTKKKTTRSAAATVRGTWDAAVGALTSAEREIERRPIERHAHPPLAFHADAHCERRMPVADLREERLVLNAPGPQTVRLLPPLIIGEAEADDALERLGRLLAP